MKRRLLSTTLKQLELRSSSQMYQEHCPNEKHFKDAQLNSNEVRQLLGRTQCCIPTPKRMDAADIPRDCDIFRYRLIKT